MPDATPRPSSLRTLLVVSRVTFVPENYDELICALAACPQIAGLLILDNRARALVPRGIGLAVLGAWRLGTTLVGNYWGRSDARRREAFARTGKPVWQLPTINCPEAVTLVQREGIDLIVNTRTRFIYRTEILQAPRLGCLNVHHGLLPDQRGTMCDLWALAAGRPAGFTIHQMAPAVDAGGIVRSVQVSDGRDRDFRAYLRKATQREAIELPAVLAEIAQQGEIRTQPNVASCAMTMQRDPTPAQVREMMRGGMRL
jgi:methionyl-tRNA formyltransferase